MLGRIDHLHKIGETNLLVAGHVIITSTAAVDEASGAWLERVRGEG